MKARDWDSLGPLLEGAYEARLHWAKQIAYDRRTGKTGQFRPMGHRDAYGRWWPHPQEVQMCCRYVKPSSQYPRTFFKHCCSLRHIAMLCGVTEQDLREEGPRRMLIHCPDCGRFIKQGTYRCRQCFERDVPPL